MNKNFRWLTGALCLGFLAATVARADEPKKNPPADKKPPAADKAPTGDKAPAGDKVAPHGDKAGMPDEKAMMDAMMKAAAPGPEHARFKNFVGNWKTETKMWMDPTGTPEVTPGEATYEVIMGGRYLEEHVKSMAMGQPFEGRGITGYDNTQKKYVGVWYDSMSTGIMVCEGTYDAATKTYTSTAEAPCCMTGKMMKHRMVEKEVDANHHVMEMYTTGDDGKEMKVMEVSYTRAAPGA